MAVDRGRDKEALARSLTTILTAKWEPDPAQALQAMGGAKAILATVTNAEAMQAISGGLGVNGTMMVIGAVGALTVNSMDLLLKRASVRGWYSGTAANSEDTLLFSQLNEIASMNEIFPLEEAQAAYDRMIVARHAFVLFSRSTRRNVSSARNSSDTLCRIEFVTSAFHRGCAKTLLVIGSEFSMTGSLHLHDCLLAFAAR